MLAWSVDNHRVRYEGGRLSVDGVRDETWRRKFSRPDHHFTVGSRQLTLKTVGTSAELWCRGILIAPSMSHIFRLSAPSDGRCGRHSDRSAVIACAKCGTFACTECEAVDGTHCVSCAGAFTEADMSAQVLAAVPGPFQYFWRRVLIAVVLAVILYGLRGMF